MVSSCMFRIYWDPPTWVEALRHGSIKKTKMLDLTMRTPAGKNKALNDVVFSEVEEKVLDVSHERFVFLLRVN